MGGFFCGVLEKGNRSRKSKDECVRDVFYGTDFHSHLGTSTGGMSVWINRDFTTKIQDISQRSFRSELMDFEENTSGRVALGSISDFEPQPLTFSLKFGRVAIAHVGKMNNLEQLVQEINPKSALSTMSKDGVNPIEIIAELINQGKDIVDGIGIAQNIINGSCSLMIATADSVYLVRDKFGRTPIFVGYKPGMYAAALEPSAFPNRGFKPIYGLGAGEIGRLDSEGYEKLKAGSEDNMQICAFLWVYYGFPASFYEGRNVEATRNENGRNHAKRNIRERKSIDFVAGIPDSGTGHAIGYADGLRVPYLRPFVKYGQTWQRSFMPSEQEQRDHVAQMKLIAIPELIKGKRILFTEDSIVRGTQLIARTEELKSCGVSEVHMRPSCPPLVYSCSFLNFSRSKGSHELAGVRAIRTLERKEVLNDDDIKPYTEEGSKKYFAMVEQIRRDIPHLISLDYQRLSDMVGAIGLPKSKLCTHCWDGSSYCVGCEKK
jgi:amidophosphoribosyltransferase